MTNIVTAFRSRMEKRALYNRTVFEIQNMPLDAQLDLGLYAGDAERIAAKAVYGS